MAKFIYSIVNKIKDITSFDTIIDLIRVDKIKVKIKEYLEMLKNKYEILVKSEIGNLEDSKAKYQIKKIKKSLLIYNQLMIICINEKYNKMKRFIYEQFLNNIKNIDSIISMFDSLEKKRQRKLFKRINEKV